MKYKIWKFKIWKTVTFWRWNDCHHTDPVNLGYIRYDMEGSPYWCTTHKCIEHYSKDSTISVERLCHISLEKCKSNELMAELL